MTTPPKLAALIAKDREGLEFSSVYYPRYSSPFYLPRTIVTHRRFAQPLDAVIWFGLMVRRAEMLTKQRLWSKAMEERAGMLADAQRMVSGNDG